MSFALLLLCFFLSGFAALLFETAWTREFATVFGTSELAVAAVLAAYMAGLAGGAAVAARLVARVRRPVLAYGVLELGIGLGAIGVPHAISALRWVYVALLGGQDALPEHLGAAALAFQLGGTFAVLVPCAALMGATLPLLARHAVQREDEIAARIGLLYAVNTAGAIAGTLCAAFLLLPALGLRRTIYAGAAVNAVVFAAAVLLARRSAAPAPAPAQTGRGGARWILPAIALSGAVSFSSEVLWTRLLSHVLGGSTPAFASMLASFLAGIAIGSALASRFARTPARAARGFALAQLGCALTGWLGFQLADWLPVLAVGLGASPMQPAPGMLAAAALLLPFTLCVGACFPAAVRLHAESAALAAAASGRVYAWNTLGSISGALAAGYLLLPRLGLEGTLGACVAANLALALAAALLAQPRRRAVAALALLAAIGVALVPSRPPWQLLRHGVFSRAPIAGRPVFLGVGRSADVALFDEGWSWHLFSNGLPEAGIQRPELPPEPARETEWLAFLPLLARPDARQMLIVGLGGARTLAAVPAAFESVDVIELEPEIAAANRVATPRRGGDPLAQPRVRLRFGDARGALALTDARWDAIVSQPSHPWTSGASHLYTREFFELAREHLAPGGVFVQWIGMSFVDAEVLASLLATLLEVFPALEVFMPEPAVLIFVASQAPLDTLASAPRALAGARAELASRGLARIEDVAAALALGGDEARALAAGAPINSDDHNRLASGVRLRSGARDALHAIASQEPLARRAQGLDLAVLARRISARGRGARLERLAAELAAPEADRNLMRGWAALDAGRTLEAAQHFERVRSLRPADRGAGLGLAAVRRGNADPAGLGLPPEAAALIEGWRSAARGDWDALRALDPALAGWQPGDLLHPEAARLRAQWRLSLAGAGAERAAEALALLEPLLARSGATGDLLLCAEAAGRAGRPALAWAALDRAVRDLRARDARQWGRAAAIARDLPEHPRGDALRRQLEELGRKR